MNSITEEAGKQIEAMAVRASAIYTEKGSLAALQFLKDSLLAQEYIQSTIPQDILRQARGMIARYNILETNLNEKRKALSDLQAKLSSLREPRLFGKEKYLTEKNELTSMSNQLLTEAGKLEKQITDLRETKLSAEGTLGKADTEKELHKTIYDHDQAAFESRKLERIKNILPDILAISQSVISCDWGELVSWMKEFLRLDPVRNILPILSPQAFLSILPVGFNIVNNIAKWFQDESVILINGRECRLGGHGGMYYELLGGIVSMALGDLADSPVYWTLRAHFYYWEVWLVTPNEFRELCRSNNTWHVLKNEKFICIPMKQMYAALSKGRECALASGGENALNTLNHARQMIRDRYGNADLSYV